MNVERADVIELDLASVKTPMELHIMLSERFRFPTYYGRNGDAFWDCITDPEQSAMPRILRLVGWSALSRRMPRDAHLLRRTLDALPSERPEIAVEWV